MCSYLLIMGLVGAGGPAPRPELWRSRRNCGVRMGST